MKYGVFGLTGDPCTEAHYMIVKSLIETKAVDKMIVIPTIVDYYRKDKVPMFSHYDRMQIFAEWFDKMEDVILDFTEYDIFKQYGADSDVVKSRRYVCMLEDVISRYKNDNEDLFITVIGEDSWMNLPTWHQPEKIAKLSDFIVVRRTLNDKQVFPHRIDGCCAKVYVHDLPVSYSLMSATAIREELLRKLGDTYSNDQLTLLTVYLDYIKKCLN